MVLMSNKRVIFQAKVSKILDHNEAIRELFLEIQNNYELKFRAGQFVMLHVPQPEKPALRAYSIASDDRLTKNFDLIFKKVPGGIASTHVWNLREGDVLDFTGPFGRVFFPEPPSKQLVFLNTGSGVAQHLSYLRSFQDRYPDMKCHLYFGLHSEKDLYYENELRILQKKLPHFQFHYVLSQPSEKWDGRKGYVQNFLNEIDYKNIETSFFLCGNGAMIRDTKQLLIERDQIDSAKIFCEAFH